MISPGKLNIGSICGVLFLFSLVIFATVFYAGSLTVVADERERVEYLSALDEVERLAFLERQLTESRRQQDLVRERMDFLEHERAKVEDRLQALQDLEAQVQQLRLSRAERQKILESLGKEIDKVKEKLEFVKREVDVRESVAARDLVPGGTARTPVFVECDGKGAWLMPERSLLEESAPSSAKELLLTRAREKGYVVFLVRPDGFKPFRRYLAVIKQENGRGGTRIDLGHEPVDADWKLVYPAN